eukprot:Nk52_evm65s1737 gene=Nk52_evmTU65s1737
MGGIFSSTETPNATAEGGGAAQRASARNSRSGGGGSNSREGLYFGTHFTLAGERHETSEPETFLFGNINDLMMLARGQAGAAPITPPENVTRASTVSSNVNVHKETAKLIPLEGEEGKYTLEFNFDCLTACSVTIFYFAEEAKDSYGNAAYIPAVESMTSPTFHYQAGMDIDFKQDNHHVVSLGQCKEEDLFYPGEGNIYPLVILIEGDLSGSSKLVQSQATYFTFEKGADERLSIKPISQKVTVDGTSYMLLEIFGIEQKNEAGDDAEEENEFDDDDESSVECVVCMVDSKDTAVLPCRHLCLCNACAEVLRYQSNKCPICRAPFHALLQLRVSKTEEEIEAEAHEVEQRADTNTTVNDTPGGEASEEAAEGGADQNDDVEVAISPMDDTIAIVDAIEERPAAKSGFKAQNPGPVQIPSSNTNEFASGEDVQSNPVSPTAENFVEPVTETSGDALPGELGTDRSNV